MRAAFKSFGSTNLGDLYDMIFKVPAKRGTSKDGILVKCVVTLRALSLLKKVYYSLTERYKAQCSVFEYSALHARCIVAMLTQKFKRKH